MKLIIITPVSISNKDLNNTFQTLFSEKALQKIHGPCVKTTIWHKNQRKINFTMDINNIPNELKKFICGDKLRVTTRQILTKTESKYTIKNNIRMHFLGAELFKIKPSFYLEEKDGLIYFGGRIEHHAILPPPLNNIAENFMMEQSKREMINYKLFIDEIKSGESITNTTN